MALRAWAAAAAMLWSVLASAGGWVFSEPVPVTGPAQAKVFHHLEASGRSSIAINGNLTAVVWEDNRDGEPRVRVALSRAGRGFGASLTLSGGTAAYEPAITALADDRFLVAWEEAGKIWLRIVSEQGAGPRLWTGATGSRHVALASKGRGRAYAAWSQPDGRFFRIVVAELKTQGMQPNVGPALAADPHPPRNEQLYPALAAVSDGLVVAWEDRREGHTRLYYTRLEHGGTFRELTQLNEHRPPPNPALGRGTGVTRVALSSNGNRVAATWMDKRDFEGGYDVYAALSEDRGVGFGANEKVQDLFGENIPQWHPAITVGPAGRVVVAWDDPRDETTNVWLSWRDKHGWSDDFTVPGARAKEHRTHPVVAFDQQGALHLAWVSRLQNGGTRIWYTVGRYQP